MAIYQCSTQGRKTIFENCLPWERRWEHQSGWGRCVCLWEQKLPFPNENNEDRTIARRTVRDLLWWRDFHVSRFSFGLRLRNWVARVRDSLRNRSNPKRDQQIEASPAPQKPLPNRIEVQLHGVSKTPQTIWTRNQRSDYGIRSLTWPTATSVQQRRLLQHCRKRRRPRSSVAKWSTSLAIYLWIGTAVAQFPKRTKLVASGTHIRIRAKRSTDVGSKRQSCVSLKIDQLDLRWLIRGNTSSSVDKDNQSHEGGGHKHDIVETREGKVEGHFLSHIRTN